MLSLMAADRSGNQNIKFEYVLAVCQAVEDFTQYFAGEKHDGFHYRNCNLRYAVERHLYYSFVDNHLGRSLYSQFLNGELAEAISVPNLISKYFFYFLFQKKINLERFFVRSKRWNIRETIENIIRKVSFLVNSQSDERKGKRDILIRVSHPKFVRFLLPLAERIDLTFLVGREPELIKYLFRCKLPVIKMPISRCVSSSLSGNKILSQFTDLLRLFEKVQDTLTRSKPKCVVVVEGNSPEDEIFNQVCQSMKIPIVCLQQGWSPIIHNGFRNMSYSKMLVWGDGFWRALKPYNPNLNFRVTGTHALNIDANLKQRKIAISFFLQGQDQLISKEAWQSFLDMIRQVADEYKNTQVIVREHPNLPLSKIEKSSLSRENIQFMPPHEASLTDVFARTFISVSIYSTTILEGIAYGVPALIVNLTKMPRFFPDIEREGAGVEFKNTALAIGFIRDIMDNPSLLDRFRPNMEKFNREYFPRTGEQAINQIIGEIEELC